MRISDWSSDVCASDHEQEAIREKARELDNAVIAPRAAAVDREEAYPWDNVRALREAGFVGMTIPRDLGGPGLGFLEVALVIEEMARVCGVTGRIAVEANMGAVSAIMAYGREAQKRLAEEPEIGRAWGRERVGASV